MGLSESDVLSTTPNSNVYRQCPIKVIIWGGTPLVYHIFDRPMYIYNIDRNYSIYHIIPYYIPYVIIYVYHIISLLHIYHRIFTCMHTHRICIPPRSYSMYT